jgi:hypothetical protein
MDATQLVEENESETDVETSSLTTDQAMIETAENDMASPNKDQAMVPVNEGILESMSLKPYTIDPALVDPSTTELQAMSDEAFNALKESYNKPSFAYGGSTKNCYGAIRKRLEKTSNMKYETACASTDPEIVQMVQEAQRMKPVVVQLGNEAKKLWKSRFPNIAAEDHRRSSLKRKTNESSTSKTKKRAKQAKEDEQAASDEDAATEATRKQGRHAILRKILVLQHDLALLSQELMMYDEI